MVERALRRAAAEGRAEATPADLWSALLDDVEGEAGLILRAAGIDPLALRTSAPAPANANPSDPSARPSATVTALLRRAHEIAVLYSRFQQTGSGEILIALLEEPSGVEAMLQSARLDPESIVQKFHAERVPPTIPVDPEFDQRAGGPPEALDLARILDANLNRAREGLRVVEEYTRFVRDDSEFSARIKEARHVLANMARQIPAHWLTLGRDTEGDVGTSLHNKSESHRRDLRQVAEVNLKRVQEALRSIEEFGKIEFPEVARGAKSLRYELYTIEKRLETHARAHQRLGHAFLYWLVDPTALSRSLEWTVREALAGGVDVIQLRDKQSADRDLLATARRIREWTRASRTLFIMNDRPDLARLSEADGVHVGQEELTVRDVRRIVGPDPLVGVSTHSLAQAQAAVAAGADYLGVGPVFPSATKQFSEQVGTELLAEVAPRVSLPWFAIGGIDESRLDTVLSAGARRIAVSAALNQAEDPRGVARGIKDRLLGATQ